MRNDSHNIIIPHAHSCRVPRQNFRRKISRFSLFLSLSLSLTSLGVAIPFREGPVWMFDGLMRPTPKSPVRPSRTARRATRAISDETFAVPHPARTFLTKYDVAWGRPWHNNCPTRNTVQSRRVSRRKSNSQDSVKLRATGILQRVGFTWFLIDFHCDN